MDCIAPSHVHLLRVTGIPGTFLALNDGTNGYQDNQDAIIHLQNYTLGTSTPIQVI